ncbi:hypothetical protein RHSIM_Rhsim06G0183500 [Rhododendron simsii]|uniref:Uncharacterized protein n=1 Tax=Rhododendron simsii TaxID=118357 RepID=A0A834H1W1_RHOSS|nr:hypothetical protein RHSIM_Rhsim06G0183500 [Rhododendron simsii]
MKSVYICIQKRPTPDLSIGENDFLYEWVVDKDMMMMSSEEEEEEGGGKVKEATAPPGDRCIVGTLTPALERMPLDVQSGSIFVALGSCIYALGGVCPRFSWKWLETGRQRQTLLTRLLSMAESTCSEAQVIFSIPRKNVQSGHTLRFLMMLPAIRGHPYPQRHHFRHNDHLNELFVPPEMYGAHLLPDGRFLLHSVCSIVSYDIQASRLILLL